MTSTSPAGITLGAVALDDEIRSSVHKLWTDPSLSQYAHSPPKTMTSEECIGALLRRLDALGGTYRNGASSITFLPEKLLPALSYLADNLQDTNEAERIRAWH